MTSHSLFFVVSTICFFLLFVIWNKSDWLNVLIKIVLAGMTVWSLILALMQFGYIVKK